MRADMHRQHAAYVGELGAVFTLIAVGGLVGYLLAGHGGGDWSALGTLARGLICVVSMSVVGKVLDLGWARLRLIQLGRELNRFQPPTRHRSAISPP